MRTLARRGRQSADSVHAPPKLIACTIATPEPGRDRAGSRKNLRLVGNPAADAVERSVERGAQHDPSITCALKRTRTARTTNA